MSEDLKNAMTDLHSNVSFSGGGDGGGGDGGGWGAANASTTNSRKGGGYDVRTASDHYVQISGSSSGFSLDVNHNGTVMDEVTLGCGIVAAGAAYTGNAPVALAVATCVVTASYLQSSGY